MRNHGTAFAVALACSPVIGCTIGARLAEFAPSHTPRGAMAELRTTNGKFDVELLAAPDSGLVVLVRDTVLAFAAYGDTQYLNIRDYRYSYATRGKHPDPASLAELRLVTRFPQGISTELMVQLLAAQKRPAAERLR